jgi:hypothetical protein
MDGPKSRVNALFSLPKRLAVSLVFPEDVMDARMLARPSISGDPPAMRRVVPTPAKWCLVSVVDHGRLSGYHVGLICETTSLKPRGPR